MIIKVDANNGDPKTAELYFIVGKDYHIVVVSHNHITELLEKELISKVDFTAVCEMYPHVDPLFVRCAHATYYVTNTPVAA